MDTLIRTGSSKAPRDVSLVSLQLETLHGEEVCLVMEVSAPEKEAHTVQHECEMILKHALLESEGEASQRLDSALKELNGLLKGMLVSGAVHDIHMIVSIVDEEGTLHVSHAGRAEAYLLRNNSASQITEYTAGKSTPGFVHIASGKLESGDLVIFSTQRLLRTLTPAQLSRLTSNRDMVLESIVRALEGEGEHAALAVMQTACRTRTDDTALARSRNNARRPLIDRRQRMQSSSLASRIRLPSASSFAPVIDAARNLFNRLPSFKEVESMAKKTSSRGRTASTSSMTAVTNAWEKTQGWVAGFIADLGHPQRKKRAHLLLIAGAIALLLIVWLLVNVFTSSQRSKTRAELETLVEQISTEIQTAENRSIIGDTDAANAILDRAEERAKEVMDNEAGLFRVEANELLGRIRAKKEQINNITRLTPRVVANLAANNPDILARGMIGLGDGEFIAYDKQDVYRVLLNSVESPDRLSEEVLIIDGADFGRFQSQVFLMNSNSVIEWQSSTSIAMKTDDAKGWVNGIALSAYLRFLYILSPEDSQDPTKCKLCKYERLSNRYGAPVEYNVNGDLSGAIDMAIDGNVYILKDADAGRTILKLFRGETQPFVIRKAPADILKTATKIFKITDRNMYVLDPENNRVIVLTDGGATGESSYLKQYVLEGEQVGTLQDLYVDDDESQLYVMDEKRIYVIELTTR